MTASELAARLAAVRARVDAACLAAGRDPTEVGLVAVSKRHPAAAIRAVQAAGHRDFGENYAQELRDKADDLDGLDVRWHFIGRVQSNKAKYVAPRAFRVHALEAVRHAEALVARAPGGVDALLYVDIGDEPTKGGVPVAEVPARLDALSAVEGLRIRGLMALPPYRDDPEEVAPFFAALRSLRDRLATPDRPLPELSMGMSHDFEVAIRHGATWVRVGTAIFGPRA